MNRIILMLAVSACLALAQDGSAIRLKLVKNAPFSAQAQTESIQTLPDGNRVTHTSSATIARDSEGRTRREQVSGGVVFIYDPVLGAAYVLDARTHSARRFALPATGTDNPALKGESLGTSIIATLSAEGTSLTRVISAGESGNDQPIEIKSEAWYSRDLQIVISSRTVDPRTGESTYKLTSVKQAEPDHSLFDIPADYTLQDSANK